MNWPALNIRHLHVFREVARSRNISKASQRVHLSQPAITQAIAKLEDVLEVSLFDRRNNGMFVTEPGEVFLARVERALSYLKRGAVNALQAAPKNHKSNPRHFERLFTTPQLRALIAVSRTRNFSLAAKKIGISQPSLHRAARDLERLLGIALFEKVSRGIQLTRAGEILVAQVNLSQAEMNQGFVEIADLRGIDASRIVIGTLPLARTSVLPRAINQLAELRPDVQISVVDGPYEDLLHGLRHGEIDILIGALREDLPVDDVEQEPLFVDRLVVVSRKDHPIAAKTRISQKDLIRYPWVVPRVGTPTREHFEKLIANAENRPRLVETSSLILGRGLLLQSDRLTMISGHQVHNEIELKLLTVLPVNTKDTDRLIGLTLRKDWRPTTSQRVFLDVLREAGKTIAQIP